MEQQWPVAPVRGLKDSKGSGVYLGGGCWLTALHVLNGAEWAEIQDPGQPNMTRSRLPGPLELRDVVSLGDTDNAFDNETAAGVRFPSVVISRLDRDPRTPLTVRGFLPGDPALTQLTGRAGALLRRRTGAPPWWELHVRFPTGTNTKPPKTLRGLSGSGVFDARNRLVGIVVEEETSRPGRVLYFASLEDWPQLWPQVASPAAWEESWPQPWEAQLAAVRERLVQGSRGVPHLLDRDPVLAALAGARDREGARGYVVLTGGPQQGKSAILHRMFEEEWTARSGSGVLCVFGAAARSKEAAVRALREQIDYVLEEGDLPVRESAAE